MADLLGSILGSIDKPPSVPENVRKKAKEEEEKLKKLKKREREEKEKFRRNVETIMSKFLKDATKTRQRMNPMNKLERSIVHEMADEAGIITQAFGVEEHDRYVMLFKKDHPATEEELDAYRKGETWDEKKAEEIKNRKKEMKLRLEEQSSEQPTVTVPASNYKDKYNHLIGTTAAKDAARKTEANKSFGMVPSHNKRDQRSIEETMNEIRAKKKKTSASQEVS